MMITTMTTMMICPTGLPGVTIGQNAYKGSSSQVQTAMNSWQAEISNFNYGGQWAEPVGHYTQVSD
jgi:hypothetical protein